MLTSLRLRNVKSWLDTGELRLAPLTGLFGTNSSGKSSILQTLLLLKQTVESTDRAQVLHLGGERALVDVGAFRDLVHGHAHPAAIEWALGWSLPVALRFSEPGASRTLFSTDQLRFAARIVERQPKPTARAVVDWFEYRIDPPGSRPGRCFGMRRAGTGQDAYELTAEGFAHKRNRGRPAPLPAPVKFYGFPEQVYYAYQNTDFLADLQLAFEQVFGQLFYLGPLRDYPRRQYVWAGTQPSDVGQRGEAAIAALLASRERGASISRGWGRGRKHYSLEAMVASWLKQLGLVHEFSVDQVAEGSNIYQVRVQRSPRTPRVLITDVGFGVSQILPVLVLPYYAPEGSTIILEQPEIHLHPAVQAGLADVLVDAVKTRNVQVILESHSEHLLRRLQRRIAEGELSADDTALYFCEMRGEASHATALDVDEYGNIRNWPPGFFGDEMGDLAAMTDAAMARQMARSGA